MGTGRVVVLNGAPRAGKSRIVAALQERVPGTWMNLGTDVFVRHVIPPDLRPGIGLRPGRERPEVAERVPVLLAALYDAVAAHARHGLDVAVDVGHHADRAPADPKSATTDAGEPTGRGHAEERAARVWDDVARRLAGLPVVVVGVTCPLEVVLDRRDAGDPERPDDYLRRTDDRRVPDPVRRWQDAVHVAAPYDLEVDTSRLSPADCADGIAHRLDDGPPRSALFGRLHAQD